LIGIPVGNAAAFWAVPPLILLLNPGINADITLASDIIQDLTMVTEVIIIEVDHLLTVEISAL
jgi:hypothetical protein